MPIIFKFLIVCYVLAMAAGSIADHRLHKQWDEEDAEEQADADC